MSDVVLMALIAGVLAIDDRAGWQSLLGEPVFSAWIIGAITGTTVPALKVGIILQLAWLSIGAARGTRRPNTVVGGVIGAGAASIVLSRTGDPREGVIVAAGVLMGLLAAELGAMIGRATGVLRERWLGNFRLSDASLDAASRRLTLTVVGSALWIGLVDFVIVCLFMPVAVRVTEMFGARLGPHAAVGATWWLICVSAIGIAAVVRAFSTRVLIRFLALGALVTLVVGWLR
jgi:mannose/fructose/N-acetylgalactosamine-specific phosphotransferase system component IIC